MANVSKTKLLGFQFTRLGAPFCEINTKSTIDSKNFDYTRLGGSFWGEGSEETVTYPVILNYTRLGAPFKDLTAKDTINAMGFDYSRLGNSFWVPYTESGPPPTYTMSQFFIMF